MHLRQLLCLVIGLYEAVVWIVGIPGFSAHDTSARSRGPVVVNGLINSVPHVLIALAPRLSMVAIGLYAPYMATFFSMQAYFWWLPYFLGVITPARQLTFQAKLTGVQRLLPESSRRLVPSAEHTILFALTSAAAVLLLGEATAVVPSSRANEAALIGWSVLFGQGGAGALAAALGLPAPESWPAPTAEAWQAMLGLIVLGSLALLVPLLTLGFSAQGARALPEAQLQALCKRHEELDMDDLRRRWEVQVTQASWWRHVEWGALLPLAVASYSVWLAASCIGGKLAGF